MSDFKIGISKPTDPAEQEEFEAVVQQAMHEGKQEITPAEAAFIHETDRHNFTEWDKRLWDRNGYSVGYNHFMSSGNAKQWGAMPRVNSGNGQFEGRIPMELFLALGAKHRNVDWWKDDTTFYSLLREHPELDGRPGKNNPRGAKFLSRDISTMLV